MRDKRYTILSTASLPAEKIAEIPETIACSIVPFIKIIPRPAGELGGIVSSLGSKKQIAIFTSAYAVKFVAGMLSRKTEWKIYCTRNETRNAVIRLFGSDSIARYADNASALSECIVEDAVKEAVFFCGDQRLDILPEYLIKNGVQLTELVVYETLLTPVRLEERPDAILFFSPSAVRSFFSMNELSKATRIFAMGKTTAAALKELTSLPVIISPESDKTFVLNMAVEHGISHFIK
jgi:uroporphyrinogen-III synthase